MTLSNCHTLILKYSCQLNNIDFEKFPSLFCALSFAPRVRLEESASPRGSKALKSAPAPAPTPRRAFFVPRCAFNNTAMVLTTSQWVHLANWVEVRINENIGVFLENSEIGGFKRGGY